MIHISHIPHICRADFVQQADDEEVKYLVTDSRKAICSKKSLFFAIPGLRHDGHDYIDQLYDKGLRHFIVERELDYTRYSGANFIRVRSAIKALQAIAAHHRSRFSLPVLGIAGNRGKTIVKEWLYQLLFPQYNCVKSPGSYNSQIGVPLSVWLINNLHEFGIFEAGMSATGEMQCLQKIIRPTVGLLTNLDSTCAESLVSEKMTLFKHVQTLIYCNDTPLVRDAVASLDTTDKTLLSWGCREDAAIRVDLKDLPLVHFSGGFGEFSLTLPFSDIASRQNILHCITVLLYLRELPQEIQLRINRIRPIPMRLELKSGINQCRLIDDTYSNDLMGGLQISLDFLASTSRGRKTVILSDALQSGKNSETLFAHMITLLKENEIDKMVGIGRSFCTHKSLFSTLPLEKKFYPTTSSFIEQIDWSWFNRETILVKGTSDFKFEQVIRRLQKNTHSTVMEIDLGAIVHNLNFFRSLLESDVKLMVMVKAFAYGSGSAEIAKVLQYHQVDYLGVAHVDEGIVLRDSGIDIPIMVMNPSEEHFDHLLEYRLEPEIYTVTLLHRLAHYLNGKTCCIHLKMDTGMHRLGLREEDLSEVIAFLKARPNMQVCSVFSHLAGADVCLHDRFSVEQADRFRAMAQRITVQIPGKRPPCHILNSSGIVRFPQFQWDMVRLGIGLYGIDPTNTISDKLEMAITLKTTVLQVKEIPPGDTIGYGRKGITTRATRIATISIGYADGFSRRYSEGRGEVLIREKKAPVIGMVCMDMTMVDVTAIEDVREGDEAIIFGASLPIQDIAEKINTIPYEILTSVGGRVKRIFHAESI